MSFSVPLEYVSSLALSDTKVTLESDLQTAGPVSSVVMAS